MQRNDLIGDFPYPSLLSHFLDISAIPRPSDKEEKIAAFLCDFARSHGLEYTCDAANNVLIRRNASLGMEDRPVSLFQGHTDMVCEQVTGKDHDFETQGITVLRDGDLWKADGTTLGADNGVAVAMMMELLTQTDFPSPALECLFTAGEETGLNGAQSFDGSSILAEQLINLDTEDLNEMVLGCAGNDKITFTMPADERLSPELCALHKTVHISIDGLAGGHSGVEIHKATGNAILICANLLHQLYEVSPFGLVSFQGGGRLNVIAPSAQAVIATPDPDMAMDFLKAKLPAIYASLPKEDSQLKIRITKKGAPQSAVVYRQSGQILRMLSLVPNGVTEWVPDCPGMVRTSSNLGFAKLEEEVFTTGHMTRSCDDAALERLGQRFCALASLAGGSCTVSDHAPGWQFDPENPLAERYAQSYQRITGEKIRRNVIHAGLECGVLQAKIPHRVYAISVGPDLKDIHSPNETLSLSSFAKLYEILRDFLQR